MISVSAVFITNKSATVLIDSENTTANVEQFPFSLFMGYTKGALTAQLHYFAFVSIRLLCFRLGARKEFNHQRWWFHVFAPNISAQRIELDFIQRVLFWWRAARIWSLNQARLRPRAISLWEPSNVSSLFTENRFLNIENQIFQIRSELLFRMPITPWNIVCCDTYSVVFLEQNCHKYSCGIKMPKTWWSIDSLFAV